MGWRPEGLVNPYYKLVVECEKTVDAFVRNFNLDYQAKMREQRILGDAFEVGADAMLMALKKSGEYVDASKAEYGYVFNHIATYPRTFKGWFMLIPDDEASQ